MSTAISVTYPHPGHETAEQSTFIIGRVASGQNTTLTLTLNQGPPEAIETVPSTVNTSLAYFSQTIPLLIGENTLSLTLTSPEGSLLDKYSLICVRLGARCVDVPQLLSPQGTWWIQPGEAVPFTLLGPNNVPVPTLEWDTAQDRQPLTLTACAECELLAQFEHFTNQTPLFATYHQVNPPLDPNTLFVGTQAFPQPPENPTPILLNTHPTPALLSRCPDNLMYRIQSPLAIIRTAPESGARLTPLPQGTCLNITGRQDTWFRFQLDATRSAWIEGADLKLSPEIALPPSPLGVIQITEEVQQSGLRIPFSHRVPYHLETQPDRLILTLYQVSHQCDFIQWQPYPERIQEAHLTRLSDEAIQLTLDIPRLSGAHLRYEDNTLLLSINTLPQKLSELRVLLDPGHGGEELGAMAPNGVAEKDWNLTFGKRLEATLHQAGVSVFMTRSEDITLSLSDRAQAAVCKYQPHIVLSLHHNALPDGRDPKSASGPSTYYYYGHSQPLAKALLANLFQENHQPPYGLLYDSLALTRIPEALSVLIELGFFTHPADVALMEQETFQISACNAILKALKTVIQPN